MRLVVLASPSANPQALGAWTLRLRGIPTADEVSPPGVIAAADDAAAELRSTFPTWLWEWAVSSGALSLTELPGQMSWWWYAPVSEQSCVRSKLVSDLYWLTLLGLVLDRAAGIDLVEWWGDDRALLKVAEQVVTARGRAFHGTVERQATRTLSRLVIRKARVTGSSLVRWFFLRRWGFASVATIADCDVAIFTRFPNLWQMDDTRWRERAFGTFPQFLESRGHRVAYVAEFNFASFRRLKQNRHAWASGCAQSRIHILECTLPLREFLKAHLPFALLARYGRWYRKQRNETILYNGLDVTELVWREMHDSILGETLPGALLLARALTSFLDRLDQPLTLLAYEYQPEERAVAAAVRARPDRHLAGVQVAMFNANQMGWALLADEAMVDSGETDRLPDLLAAYGELAYGYFSRAIGRDRVALCGPIRYPDLLAREMEQREASEKVRAEPRSTGARIDIPVAVSSSVEEAIPLIRAAFAACHDAPRSTLVIQFHPLLQLEGELRQIAKDYPSVSYRVVSGDLLALAQRAGMLICAGTSMGIEAIATGSMPLVFRTPALLSANPMLHVPDAVFFWSTATELHGAIDSCLRRDVHYQERVAAWSGAIAAHLYRLDGGANARLYDALAHRCGLRLKEPSRQGPLTSGDQK